MATTFTQAHRLLELETPLGKDALILTDFTGREAISQLFHYRLELFSENMAIAPEQLIGKPVGFHINSKAAPQRYFHGIVNRFCAGSTKFRAGRHYRIEVVPRLWMLTQSIDCRIFQNKTTTNILEEVFKKFNLNQYSISDIKASQKPRPYCVQYHETTFDFISRLLEEEGIYYFFRHEKNQHTLVLTDNINSFKPVSDQPIMYTTGSYLDNHISHWERQYNFGVGQWTQTSYDFEKPSTNLRKSTTTLIDIAASKSYEKYVYSGSDIPSHETSPQSKLRMESEDAQYDKIIGTGHCPIFMAGTVFTLKTQGTDVADQEKYALMQVEHSAYDHTHMDGDTQGQGYENHFICMPRSVAYRPSRTTKKPCIHGLQTAVVVGASGEEIFTDKYGRVKVQFHWDREGKKDDKSSCWIRVAQIWAGKQWGAIHIPRIGQEVVVSFLEGDPDQPLIIGSVYNAEQMPPYALPNNRTQSGVKSRSSKQGGTDESNELRFEDKKGEEAVYFHAQKDFTRVVEHDDSLEVKNDQAIVINQKRTITVNEGDETTTLKKGNRSITVEKGNDTHVVKIGNRAVTVETGNDSLEIKKGNQTTKIALGKSTLEAMQSIELKVGSNSIKIDQAGITLKGIKVTIQGTLVEIKADASLKAQGTITEVNGSGLLKLQGALTMIN
jgi:type VI secretion system secreted protein VgrG